MANVIKLRKGLDVNLKGQAAKEVFDVESPGVFALMPDDFREPTYIPAGFEETTSSIHTGYGAIIYESEKTEYVLSYSCMDFNTFLSLDTEDCMVESVSVDGYKAYLYTKYRGDLKGHTSLIWQDGSYIHLISGPITKREIIKMAESLY